jgi:hypothetical protein
MAPSVCSLKITGIRAATPTPVSAPVVASRQRAVMPRRHVPLRSAIAALAVIVAAGGINTIDRKARQPGTSLQTANDQIRVDGERAHEKHAGVQKKCSVSVRMLSNRRTELDGSDSKAEAEKHPADERVDKRVRIDPEQERE